MRILFLAATTLGLTGCALPHIDLPSQNPTNYRAISIESLASAVRGDSISEGTFIEVTALVDARFKQQIVIDLRNEEGQVVSRRAGDCIQVLLPIGVDQNTFDTGRYIVRGSYSNVYLPEEGFRQGINRYEPACGTAYLFARQIVKAD